jgi:hypothetical protein
MSGRQPADVTALDASCMTLLDRVTGQIERVLTSAAGVATATASFCAAAQQAGRPLRHADLAALRPVVADVLREHDSLVAGAGVVLAPDTLADAPRCIDWWWAGVNSGPEQLQVDLDPESAEFYDYTTTEWYRSPERTGMPTVAGPYVDYICTHQYTFTLAVPIVHDRRFVGVAGADILASRVEQLVLPALSRIDRAMVLIGGNGRVIASNTASILPGAVVSRQPLSSELVPVAGLGHADMGRALPWTLLSLR